MPLKHSVEEIHLKNGAKGLLIDIPDATVVSYDVHFRAGNHYVARPEAQQTAHIMEHMVFGSTKKFPSIEAFSQEFTKNGAYNNATTWQFNMSYYADCAVLEWDRILDLQRQAISEPDFSQSLLDAEKGNVLEELTGQANNNSRFLWQAVNRALGDTMLVDAEKITTVPAVTLEDINAHHKNTHTLKNMRFSFAGDLGKHRQEIISIIEGWQLPVGERLDVPQSTFSTPKNPVFIYRKDLPSVLFSLQLVLNRRLNDEEEVAMSAVNHLLTGTLHSRVWGKARVRGICYGMNSSIDNYLDGLSNWELSGQIRPQNMEAMFTLIAEELQKILDGDMNEKELYEAKQYALGSYQMRGQTVRAVNNWYSGHYFDTDEINYMDNSPKEIEATTIAVMERLVKEFLQQGKWAVGIIGNTSEADVKKLHDIIAALTKKR